ncbi:3'-5' exonuclease [Halomonas sp. Bachu 37]|uniref:3'-5' exonuclease n=1 Tax=Halomonas kashgarensis TaxID=3084920 RepID=UPI0032178419
MLKALRRESNRRRYAKSPYAWLFQPYTGDELVAIDCRTTRDAGGAGELFTIAMVKVRQDRVLTSGAQILHILPRQALSRKTVFHLQLEGVDFDAMLPCDEALEKLLAFIGTRPLVGWRLESGLAVLNQYLERQLGFELPNAQIDVAQLHMRQLRRLHPQVELLPRLSQVARQWNIPRLASPEALADATTTALIYMRQQRALTASG